VVVGNFKVITGQNLKMKLLKLIGTKIRLG